MPISPAAIGIVFNKDKTNILLVKRKDIPLWVLPGGGIDPHETAEQAIRRETLEETGLTVEIERKCAEYTPINTLASFTTVFICQVKGGKVRLSSETADIQFFPLQKLPPTFFYIHREWLQDALHYPYLIKKPLQHITYWAVFKYFACHPIQVARYLMTRLKQE